MVRPDLITHDNPPNARLRPPFVLRAGEAVELEEQSLAGRSPEGTAESEDWLETA